MMRVGSKKTKDNPRRNEDVVKRDENWSRRTLKPRLGTRVGQLDGANHRAILFAISI